MPRLSLFHIVTALAVLTAGAVGWLALAGNLSVAVALVGVTLLLVAVLHVLAERRTARANRRVLSELRALSNGLGSLSTEQAALGKSLSGLNDDLKESAERARFQSEGAERRLLASIDAARLEAANTRTGTSLTS